MTAQSLPGYRVSNVLSAMPIVLAYRREFFAQMRRDFDRFGDMYIVKVGDVQQVILRHPDHIHELTTRQADKFHKDATYTDPHKGLAKFLGNGLINSDGEFWKRQRKLMSPAFHHRRIIGYVDIITDEAVRLVEKWHGDSRSIDVDHDMMRATLTIVAKALFKTDMHDDDVNRIGASMTTIQEFSGDVIKDLLPSWLPTLAKTREARAIRELDDVVYRVIAEHRAIGTDNGDLLWMLLDARDEDGNGMTDRQIRDELVTLFLAGHETTANTLNWAWVLLAQHPDQEAALHTELDTVLGGRLPTMEDLKRLPYTEQVIKEAMRLYPPAYGFGRVALEAVQIGGYTIPKGATVSAVSWETHRDERWYPDAAAFQPERWTPEIETNLPKGAYIPFGGGPRICIGLNFAMMEAQLLLATLASRYSLRLIDAAPEPDALLTLRPKGGLTMRVIPRERISAHPLLEMEMV